MGERARSRDQHRMPAAVHSIVKPNEKGAIALHYEAMLAELNAQVEDLRGDHGAWRQHAEAAMIRIMLAVGMLVVTGGGSAFAEGVPGAQQRDCFAVTMNPTATLGAILVDKCTGNSWILGRVKPSTDATTLRWFPLSVEKRELVVPNEEKNDEDAYAGF
jgi:hypothetical protein